MTMKKQMNNPSDNQSSMDELSVQLSYYKHLAEIFRLIADNSPDMLWAKNLDDKYIFANRAICNNLLNAENTDEPLDKSDLFFAERERQSHPENQHWHTFGEICQDTDQVVKKNLLPTRFDESGNVKGKFLFLDVYKAPLFDNSGNLIGTVGSAREVTKEKEIEKVLKDAQEKFQLISENSHDVIWIRDLNLNFKFVSPSCLRVKGFTVEETMNQKLEEIFALDSLFSITNLLEEEIQKDDLPGVDKKRTRTIVLREKCKDEKLIWTETVISFIRDEKKSPVGILGITRDISNRKQIEEALLNSEARYSAVMRAFPDLVFVNDRNGFCLEFYAPDSSILPFEGSEIIGKNFNEIFNQINPSEFQEVFDVLFSAGDIQIKEYITEFNNEKVYFEVRFVPFQNDKVLNIVRNITDLKKAEKLKEVSYKIAEAVNSVNNLDELFKFIHQSTQKVMQANNFYIALYNHEQHVINFPYFVDEIDEPIQTKPVEKGLTEYVLRTGKSLLATPDIFNQLRSNGEVDLIGEDSVDWLGVPLKSEDRVFGVIVVQSYEQKLRYTEANKKHLEFIANQAALAIVRKKAEDEQSKLIRILTALAKAEEILLTKNDYENNLNSALKLIGEAVQVDRVYVFENHLDEHNNEHFMSQRFEWCSSNAVPQINNQGLQNLSYEKTFPKWHSIFLNHQHIAGLVRDFAETERKIFEDEDIKSILIFPIFSEKVFWGFIGIDDCWNERLWTETEIAVLSAMANNISSLIRRRKFEKELSSSEKKYRLLAENIADVVFTFNLNMQFQYVSPSSKHLTGYESDELYLKKLSDLLTKDSYKNAIKVLREELQKDKSNAVGIDFPSRILEIELIRKDLTTVWCEVKTSFIREESGRAIRILGIARDITIRKQAELEMILSKQKAEEMSNLKSNFLANMSHELRTPLTGILGISEYLNEELQGTEYQEMVEGIHNSGKRLLQTLNMILNLSKIESEKYEIKHQTISISKVIKEIHSLFLKTAERRGILLNTNLKLNGQQFVTDEKLFRDILINLVENAIKYTEIGSVAIEAEKYNGSLIIRVKDTGIGISKEKLDLIFEPFRQASEGIGRSFEGTGLGLTITKKYVETLNGKIFVESKFGEGTCFTIEFPFFENEPESEKQTEIFVSDKSVNSNQKEKLNHKRKNILVVDDDITNLMLVKLFLDKIHDITTANNGATALELLKQNKFDVILMDINLGSGMSGLEVIQCIKNNKNYSDVPIIAVTAFAMSGDKQEFLSKGCSNYISKPFDRNELLNIIDSI